MLLKVLKIVTPIDVFDIFEDFVNVDDFDNWWLWSKYPLDFKSSVKDVAVLRIVTALYVLVFFA